MEDEGGSSSFRTRSKAAPDWTVKESLILVNEISAIEADCRGTLSSFQKWKIIVENCNALDVNRNLNHCRRKWASLLSDYKKIKQQGMKKVSFNSELFKAIERYVREYDNGYDTEDGTDSEEAPDPLPAAIVQPELPSSSKNQRAKEISAQKHTVAENTKPTKRMKSENIEVEECSSEQRVACHTNTLNESTNFVKINQEEHEQIMAEKLRENAEVIETIVKEQMGEDLVIGRNAAHDLTRINCDTMIVCLSNIAVTLDELCRLQTNH